MKLVEIIDVKATKETDKYLFFTVKALASKYMGLKKFEVTQDCYIHKSNITEITTTIYKDGSMSEWWYYPRHWQAVSVWVNKNEVEPIKKWLYV